MDSNAVRVKVAPFTALFALVFAAIIGDAAAAERIEPLPPDKAFRLQAVMDGNNAVVHYQMPEGIYLYRDKVLLTTATPSVKIAPPVLPPGTVHDDPFFGRTTVYYQQLSLHAAISGAGAFDLVAISQGCDEQIGICYPPQIHTVALVAGNAGAPDSGGRDESTALAAELEKNNIFWTIIVFFLLGAGLSLTPCVLPMLPILLGILGSGEKSASRIRAVTACYIAGVTVAFTGFGVLAAYTGQLLTVFLQQPAVLAAVAVLLIALALSMFDAYPLRLPAFFHRTANRGKRGGLTGAFLMGFVSAIVASPCVAAPLVGALLFIAKTGDVIVGAMALMSLALGMSVLLAASGIAGSAVLPHAGAWMNGIKRFFGCLLLLLAVWIASPLLPDAIQLLSYGVLLILTGILGRPFSSPPADSPMITYCVKTFALAALLWGALMLIGAAGGGRDVLTPLSGLSRTTATESDTASAPAFQPVRSLTELQHAVAAATQPVMLEIYADWCVSCKELEAFTFSDTRVQAQLRKRTLLRADVTANTDADRALLRHFNLFGPPAVVFYDRNGELIKNVRLIGYENADDFLRTLTATER